MTDNNVTLVGNITRDPELRFTPAGAANATFGLAVNRRWQNRQTNEWEEKVSFFNVVVWREMAENAAESLTKGMRVMVAGRLEQRSWETQEGEKRTVVEIAADEIGPSLRWASAQVTRNERRQGGDGGDFGGGASRPAANEDFGSGSNAGGSGSNAGGSGSNAGGSGSNAGGSGGNSYSNDEEPF